MNYLDDLRSLLRRRGRRDDPAAALRFIALVLQQLDDRLDPLEKRLLIVDALPASAPFGALIRVRGDATGALYTGNGAGRPLGKITPTAV